MTGVELLVGVATILLHNYSANLPTIRSNVLSEGEVERWHLNQIEMTDSANIELPGQFPATACEQIAAIFSRYLFGYLFKCVRDAARAVTLLGHVDVVANFKFPRFERHDADQLSAI